MSKKKTVRLTSEHILNCLAHIEQWVGFVRLAVMHYDYIKQESVFQYGPAGHPTPPPLRLGCPPDEEASSSGSSATSTSSARNARRRRSRN